jgi:chloride channel 2
MSWSGAHIVGMIIGREGPFVHVSSIVSFQLVRRIGVFAKIMRVRSISSSYFRILILQSEFLIRELLTTAVVVGVACSFGSVFGAIVFSIEVTSTSYQTRYRIHSSNSFSLLIR